MRREWAMRHLPGATMLLAGTLALGAFLMLVGVVDLFFETVQDDGVTELGGYVYGYEATAWSWADEAVALLIFGTALFAIGCLGLSHRITVGRGCAWWEYALLGFPVCWPITPMWIGVRIMRRIQKATPSRLVHSRLEIAGFCLIVGCFLNFFWVRDVDDHRMFVPDPHVGASRWSEGWTGFRVLALTLAVANVVRVLPGLRSTPAGLVGGEVEEGVQADGGEGLLL